MLPPPPPNSSRLLPTTAAGCIRTALFVLECRPGMRSAGYTSQVCRVVQWGLLVTLEGWAEPRGGWATTSVALPLDSFKCSCRVAGSVPHSGRIPDLLPAGSWGDSAISLWLVKFSSLAHGNGPGALLGCKLLECINPLKGGPKAQWRIKILQGSDVLWCL